MSLTRNTAETIAIDCFTWLVGNEDLLPVFLGSTGASQENMRNAVTDPDFLASVLDFILMDDAWVMACCDTQQIPYERVGQARMALPGGEQRNWT